MNLLSDPTFTLSSGVKVSLPGLFSALACGQACGFPYLRPHQRPAWHMFLVQLGASALRTAECNELPAQSDFWTKALRRLTEGFGNDEPWQLVVDDKSVPAFLQPPAPPGLKWQTVWTPDALDMLITARNHDLKQAVAQHAAAEDWIYALVSLQTCEGYGGKGNHGVARMNGGSSSRPLLGLAPASSGVTSANPSEWWIRDVKRLISTRQEEQAVPGDRLVLLWCLDWPEGVQLDVRDLDPWFIEVCRRVRLTAKNGVIRAQRATSGSARVDAKALKGNTGDPWAPVHLSDHKNLTIGSRDFDYKLLCDLLFSGNWEVPLLARPDIRDDKEMLLVAEAFSRGNSKTEGFKSRIVPVPGKVKNSLVPGSPAAELASAQMEEIKSFDKALGYSLALMSATGDRDRLKNDRKFYSNSDPARRRFDQAANRLFFPSLWRRVDVRSGSDDAAFDAKHEFLSDLMDAAKVELELELPVISCPAVLRPRATVRSRSAFFVSIWKCYPGLFEREDNNGNV